MKYFAIFTLLLVALVALTSAQRCVGRPARPSCQGARDVGRRGRRCTPRNMWYYDARSRECREMRYLGCFGNNNRWCTKALCEQACRRRD